MADFGRCVEKPAKIKRSANAAAGLASRAAAVVAPFTPVLTTTTAAGAECVAKALCHGAHLPIIQA